MSELTYEQRMCVQFCSHASDIKKHLIIEAGAGAGKTQVLTERIDWLLQNKNPYIQMNPSHLFVVTFSKDAASEISERVETKLQQKNQTEDLFSLIHISTIDSFFAELVQCIYPSWWDEQQKKYKTNYMPPRLQLINDNIVYQALDLALANFFKKNTFTDHQLATTIDFILSGGFKKGFAKNKGTLENILSTMCSDSFLSAQENELRIVAKNIHPSTLFLLTEIHKISRIEYEKRLLKGEMTYSDRTVFLKENLKKNIPIKIQELIVDEYQDTNHIQHSILFHLVQECQARMVVVGDPKQSIYGFRNASVNVFQSLKQDSEWKHIELKKNFRSTSALLSEINTLSKLTFSWQNPSCPNAFKDSFFYKEALQKFIHENALEVGSEALTSSLFPSISVVTASLNKDRIINEVHKDLILRKKIKLTDYSLASFADFLKNFKREKNEEWANFVFLCETNRDAINISKKLKIAGIPVKCIAKNDDQKSSIQEFNVALSLAKILAFEDDTFDLYEVLQSPLSPYRHLDIEEYFSEIKNKNIIKNRVLEIISDLRAIAKDNFFKAWQTLRWKIVELHDDKNLKYQASVFCARMDPFAKALHTKLASHTFRCMLENKIAKIMDNNELESETLNYSILPDSLDKWDIEIWDNEVKGSEDCIEVKTVHGAKGLQWKIVCFLPCFGAAKSIGKFTIAQSTKHLDISWLQDDSENMSTVKRVSNNNFDENDCSFEYKRSGELKKTHWFAVWRNTLEKEFERQRVFYTAFTRAKNYLILFQPMRRKNDGLRDELSELKTGDMPQQNYLEEDVYLRYLDKRFSLRCAEKPKGKGSKSLPHPLPPDPWFQAEEKSPIPYYSEDKNIAFYDYGPQFLEPVNAINTTQENISSAITPQTKNNIFEEDEIVLGPKIDKNEEGKENEEQEDILESNTREQENILEKIRSLKKNRELISKGILYHAAAENRKAKLNSAQHFIEKNAIKVFHELEIWSKQEDKLNFLNSSRNILDLLAIFKIDRFIELELKQAYDFEANETIFLQDFLAKQNIDTYVILIVDFKTGKKTLEHLKQINNYMKILYNYSFKGFDVSSFKKRQYLIMGALCYNKYVEDKGATNKEDVRLPTRQFESGEQFYLFK